MSKNFKALYALICAVILAGCLGLPAFADDGAAEDFDQADPIVLPCSEVPLYIDDTYIGSGIMVDSATYVPLLTFTEYMLQSSCEALWDQETGSVTLSADLLNISLTVGQEYMTVNGRCLYLEDGTYNINGTIVVPIRELAKIFNLGLHWDSDNWAILIDRSQSAILTSGEEFYDEDSLYWLSRVIFSESGNQPLAGMIGVGNVVLNRANDQSGAFGPGIYGVIFQEGQFDVVRAGSIYMQPSEKAVIAAKLCLEGYNTVGDSKWFVNPKIGLTTWFDTYKTRTISIADHDFYS